MRAASTRFGVTRRPDDAETSVSSSAPRGGVGSVASAAPAAAMAMATATRAATTTWRGDRMPVRSDRRHETEAEPKKQKPGGRAAGLLARECGLLDPELHEDVVPALLELLGGQLAGGVLLADDPELLHQGVEIRALFGLDVVVVLLLALGALGRLLLLPRLLALALCERLATSCHVSLLRCQRADPG